MSQMGIGAMLHVLGGGSENPADKYYGRKIKNAFLKDNTLSLTFEDGVQIDIFDDGQSCCETRYMRTDDDIAAIIGNKLIGLLSKDAASREEGYETKEVVFLEVKTDKSSIVFSNHNEHNGYYGGFGMTIKEINNG